MVQEQRVSTCLSAFRVSIQNGLVTVYNTQMLFTHVRTVQMTFSFYLRLRNNLLSIFNGILRIRQLALKLRKLRKLRNISRVVDVTCLIN